MKTKLLLSFITATVFSVCHAQRVEYGITTDLNLTKMNAKGLSSTMQTGYNGGAFANIAIIKKWSIQPEVLYTLQNMRKNDDFETYYVSSGRSISNTDISARFISIPLFAKYDINRTITIYAGPEYNIMLYDNDNLLKSSQPAFKKNTTGIIAGTEITVSPSFSFFSSYYYGISNICNIDDRYRWHSNQLRFGINVRVL